jgi:hypothetical protein
MAGISSEFKQNREEQGCIAFLLFFFACATGLHKCPVLRFTNGSGSLFPASALSPFKSLIFWCAVLWGAGAESESDCSFRSV